MTKGKQKKNIDLFADSIVQLIFCVHIKDCYKQNDCIFKIYESRISYFILFYLNDCLSYHFGRAKVTSTYLFLLQFKVTSRCKKVHW
jgi:hypothetical protein